MITLIGVRCTHSNVLSQDLLITRILLGNMIITNNRVLTKRKLCKEIVLFAFVLCVEVVRFDMDLFIA